LEIRRTHIMFDSTAGIRRNDEDAIAGVNSRGRISDEIAPVHVACMTAEEAPAVLGNDFADELRQLSGERKKQIGCCRAGSQNERYLVHFCRQPCDAKQLDSAANL